MTEHNVDLEIGVLGPLLVRISGVEREFRAAKQRQLLARLVLDAGRVVSTDQLIDALWGEAPPATVAKNLQVLVGRLRSIVGADVIQTRPGGYALDPDACHLDLVEFERLVELGHDAERDGRIDDAIDAFERAGGLWRGDVAAELSEVGGKGVVRRLSERMHVASESGLRLREGQGSSDSVIREIAERCAQFPYRESICVLHARALIRRGDGVGARDVVARAIDVLDRELGLMPGTELRSLAEELRIPASTSHSRHDEFEELGPRFQVADVLARASIDEIELLDRLEALVEQGALRREIDPDGQVFLVRASAGAR